MSSDYGNKHIESFFQTEKPDYFTNADWESINDNAQNKYLEILSYELSYSSKEDLEKLLRNKNSKINYLSDEYLKKITKYAEQLYCLSILEDSFLLSYKELADKYDFTLFDSQRIIMVLKLIDKIQSIEKLMNLPIKNIEKLDSPETVDKALWKSIIAYRTQKDELDNKLFEINNEKTNLKPKIEKISKQLDFINTFLNFPNAIDRIEDYENLFAKGNYENLRKLKEMFEKAK